MTAGRRQALEVLAASIAAVGGQGRQGRREIPAVLKRYAEAWLANDLKTIVACYHDQFSLHYFGSNPLSGHHIGKAKALAVLAEFGRLTDRRLLSIVDIMAGAHRGAIVVRERLGRAEAATEVERMLLYRVQEGQFVECWVYDADQPLIDSLLSTPPERR